LSAYLWANKYYWIEMLSFFTVSLKVNWTFISWVFFIFKRPFVCVLAFAFEAATTKQMFSYVKKTIYFWWALWQCTFATRFWRSSSWLLFFTPCFSELHCSLKTMNSSIHLHYSCEHFFFSIFIFCTLKKN